MREGKTPGESDGSAQATRAGIARPRLLDQVHQAIRRRYYSRRTEEAYVHWIKRFIYYSGKRHPEVLGESEVTAFLNHLATDRHVAAATQNQALSAILFLYKEVLGLGLGWLDGLVRASRPPRLPAVLTRAEVERLLAQLTGTKWLIASLRYGSGLRVMECLRLRVKDVDLSYRQILVRDGKGEKDRVTVLPGKLVEPLRAHIGRVRLLHARDQGSGRRWNRETRELPHAQALVRDAFARGRLRHPHGAGAARALGRLHHDDLHARAQPRRARGGESARPAVTAAYTNRLSTPSSPQ